MLREFLTEIWPQAVGKFKLSDQQQHGQPSQNKALLKLANGQEQLGEPGVIQGAMEERASLFVILFPSYGRANQSTLE